ncbi:uncharacterized protein V1513DRAFT_443856 [Lipomyces chichibuensis]|uniref:uncharacterized protein n=1 Tax=Lipomyces chichibuensis TaxID=1546026 RepID=UPI00334351F4
MDYQPLPLNSPSSDSPESGGFLSSGYITNYFGFLRPARHQAQSPSHPWHSWLTGLACLKFRRRLKRTTRLVLLVSIFFVVIFALGRYWDWLGIDLLTIPSAKVSQISESEQDLDLRNQERAKFEAHVNLTRQLAAHESPLSLLRYCSNSRYKPSNANFLVSAVVDEGTLARMDFGPSPKAPRYNPNILPFPKVYKHPYIGFARQSPQRFLFHHEVVWCEMDWVESPVIGRKMLACVGKETVLNLDEWATQAGVCKLYKYLALKQGHTDPRVLFSPLGEPLMVVGTNGLSNCMNQFVIDLRAVIPGLNWKMKLHGVPIRFKRLTELPRPKYNEVEKNWFLMWDESNVEYVQHETEQRSISAVSLPPEKQVNIALPAVQKCLSSLKKTLDSKQEANDIHQATNSLRVTLCDFPCIPTIHNTVIIELIHVKYQNRFEFFYRRYAIIMNATAPFNIIGRTGNLMYAGTDENVMLYTVSMTWDHEHYQQHQDWNETVHGGHWFFEEVEERERKVAHAMSGNMNEDDEGERAIGKKRKRTLLHKRVAPADHMDTSRSVANALSSSAVTVSTLSTASLSTSLKTSSSTIITSSASSQSTATPTKSKAVDSPLKPLMANRPIEGQSFTQNPLVNKYYHGWLDDMIMINIGINDEDAGVLHIRARDMLECIHVCNE